MDGDLFGVPRPAHLAAGITCVEQARDTHESVTSPGSAALRPDRTIRSIDKV
jgi:hypothetical protein